MSVGELLQTLRANGIHVSVVGDRLKCAAPPGKLTKELTASIQLHKAALLELLRDVPVAQPETDVVQGSVDQTEAPLSQTQQRIVLANGGVGLLPTAFLLRGELDEAALADTLDQIVARHASLRSRFELKTEPPRQLFLPHQRATLEITDLRQEADSQQRLDASLLEQCALDIDPEQSEPYRFHLYRLSANANVLFTGFSPLVFDGWCFDIFWTELTRGYAARSQNEAFPFPVLRVSYADLVAWQARRMEARRDELAAFWRSSLGERLPPLPLPLDHERDGTYRAGRRNFVLERAAASELKSFAGRNKTTTQMVMLAALYALLARIGGRREMVVATPVECRLHPNADEVIGPFSNILLLRFGVDPESSFAEFTQRLQQHCLSCYDHQEYPLQAISVRAPAGSHGLAPAFQWEFSYQQVDRRSPHMGLLSLTQLELPSGATANDITVWVKDWGDRIAVVVEFKAELYDEQTVEHWSACYQHHLMELVRHPELPLSRVDQLGAEQSTVERAWEAARGRSQSKLEPRHGELLAELRRGAEVRIIDVHGAPAALGQAGELQLRMAADQPWENASVRAWVRHDGELREPSPDAVEQALPEAEPAATDSEQQMVDAFSKVLGLERVGVNHGFFDLGGNSLAAVRLFNEIHERFGVRLSQVNILRASTPRELAALISGRFKGQGSCLVELRPGQDPCLFLVHDADGETLLYRNLAQSMPDGVAVYGVEPKSEGSVPMVHATIEAMAAHYVAEIRQRQPQGPYHLGGLCAGGVIAFEMAHQLEEMGERVQLLALCEAAARDVPRRATVSSERKQRLGKMLRESSSVGWEVTSRKLLEKASNVLRYETERRGQRLRGRLLVRFLRDVYPILGKWPGEVPTPTAREIWDAAEADYQPATLTSTTPIVVRASTGSGNDIPYRELFTDDAFGWRKYSRNPPHIVDVPGGHSTMFQRPNVSAIARTLAESFRDASSAADDPARPSSQSEAEELHG